MLEGCFRSLLAMGVGGLGSLRGPDLGDLEMRMVMVMMTMMVVVVGS